jgi:uncharacterized membrane protein YdjX (TVP38/TMEM64 family)
MQKKGTGKALLMLLFITGSVLVFRYTPLQGLIDPKRVQAFIDSIGPWGPVAFILIYAAGICLFLPATLFTGIGAVVYGPFYGFLYNEIGAMLGASTAFFIGRYLGRDFAGSLIGDRLKKYDDKIALNGFATTLYLRLAFFPFTALNFGMGLTRVTFRDFFFGTLFGIIDGGFVLTFFIATLAEIRKSGDWLQLADWKTVLSVALFVASFFIPKALKRIRKLAVIDEEEKDTNHAR